MSDCHSCSGCAVATAPIPARPAVRPHVVAIIGPPNSGKSTLFNRLTGLRQKVANFPGVTVEQRIGRAKMNNHREVILVDLPGVYSLNPRSEDEQVTRDVLTGQMQDVPKPDAVLLILDSTNLGRHLVLAAPILSLKLPTLVTLNMADDLSSRGGQIDTGELASQLGAPVALISASKGDGVEKVFQFMVGTSAGTTSLTPPKLELPILQDVPRCRQWARDVGIGAAYQAPSPPLWTRRLDAIFLHPVIGPLIFLAVVAGVFQTIFRGAKPLMDGLQALVQMSGHWIGSVLPAGIIRSLLVEGVWNGVGSVIVFLPQILLLFLFIGILEDSGYLARAALIADRTMAKFGLQGKAFIPLLSAYACAVPAIMATRTIENKRERIATILVAPFMTCSARLPIYTLMIAAFIPNTHFLGGAIGMRALVMLGLYALGFLAAMITAKLLNSKVMKASAAPFILELPQYRWPTPQGLALRLYDRGKLFVKKAGTIILACTFAVWVLSVLPMHRSAGALQFSALTTSFIGHLGQFIEPVLRPLGFNWKIGVGLLSSIIAREVIVGTLGTLYGVDPATHGATLQAALRHDMTLGGAIALVVFFAFAMQCTSTLAVVRRETNSWKLPAAQFCYMTGLAYLAALATNQILSRIF